MGDDAEYWIEQQAEELTFEKFENPNSGLKSLVCWLDDVETEIWNWAPGCRVPEWVYLLYKDLKVGGDFFLAKSIQADTDQDVHPPAQNPFRAINGIVYELSNDNTEAHFEVIVISRQELSKIKETAERLKSQASNLKEECFAEMVDEIAVFIEEESYIESFVLHMEI
ncbi:hypothetical protein H6F75_00810 [Nodosilinea sp. FACHB-131]|uniref:hypothetical protein n=1 Tax=Cyanophyceae TaxID=3028117 RepID=UPI0016829B76|nr:hypothetical protein [Nodosilinea sp. FACHB-131]MBD1872011.1 hypothetical protein [Nodosilinea sp. FACHB-131]